MVISSGLLLLPTALVSRVGPGRGHASLGRPSVCCMNRRVTGEEVRFFKIQVKGTNLHASLMEMPPFGPKAKTAGAHVQVMRGQLGRTDSLPPDSPVQARPPPGCFPSPPPKGHRGAEGEQSLTPASARPGERPQALCCKEREDGGPATPPGPTSTLPTCPLPRVASGQGL